MKFLNALALTLVIAGAINWGLISLFNFDLVAAIAGTSFGDINPVNRIIYGIVGLAGVYAFVFYPLVASEPHRRPITTP